MQRDEGAENRWYKMAEKVDQREVEDKDPRGLMDRENKGKVD